MEVISSIYNSGYNIKKFYLGSRELNLAYLGNQVIYDEVIGDNDLNYILYEFYGSDTLPNTVEAPVKSAILKGQTVVNLARNFKYQIGWKYDWGGETENAQRCSYNVESAKGNTKYLIKNFNESTQAYIRYYSNSSNAPLSESGWLDLPAIITTPTNTAKFAVSLRISDNNEEYISPDQANKNLVVECQGDVENYDIPYGELVSVKLPVLTTTGKNLFDGKVENGKNINSSGQVGTGNRTIPVNFIKVTPNTDYTLTRPVANGNIGMRYYSLDQSFISSKAFSGYQGKFSATFTTPSNCYFIKFIDEANMVEKGYQIESGSVATTFEPYRTNVLTVNEDITLRSNGDVYDELNLLTGRLTQRIDENNEVLSQEVVKTVDLTIVDQDGKIINKLNSFNGATHVSTEVAENSAYPMVSLEVASELQAAMSKVTEDIELIKPVQNDIETTIDTQSNDIDSLLLATTELFEMIL